jgi:hypothetical protein
MKKLKNIQGGQTSRAAQSSITRVALGAGGRRLTVALRAGIAVGDTSILDAERTRRTHKKAYKDCT